MMQSEHDSRATTSLPTALDVAPGLHPDLQILSRYLEGHGNAIPRH